MATTKYVSKENLSAILSKIKATYVQQVSGKGLSTNDFTNELLEKLNGVAAGAQVNVIESVSVNGVAQTITEKNVDITVPTKVSELTNDSAYLTVVSEGNLDTALAEKVNAASEGNHAHLNKAELDLIESGDKAKWDAATSNVNTLVGEDTGKTVRTIANEELAAQLIADDAKESLDTLAEIAAWIQSHPDDAAAMNAAISALETKVDTGDQTVTAYVTSAINALTIGDYAKAADLTALAARVTALEAIDHSVYAKQADVDDRVSVIYETISEVDDKVDAIAADYVKASELVALTDEEIETIWANA